VIAVLKFHQQDDKDLTTTQILKGTKKDKLAPFVLIVKIVIEFLKND